MEYSKIINDITNIQELHRVKTELIGKNGIITNKIKELSKLSIEEKKEQGKQINNEKNVIEKLIYEKEKQLNEKKDINFDHSIFFENNCIGTRHIISESINLINQIFQNIGFSYVEGPDIEKAYYNFDALNMPENHPARDNNDTFYMSLDKTELLRTQVTAVQIRILENMKNSDEEIRSYSIGNVFRNDDHDSTHSCQFQQIEGIIIENGVTIKHLKGFIEYLLENFFERKIKITFRPSYFPFTEPSCEIYAYTKIINNKLELNESGEPLEIGGCGIIHPNILKKFNKEDKQTFAFGMGLERLIMLKYGIKNLHSLYNNKIPELRELKKR